MANDNLPNPTLVLSFYGDGPYWDNIVRMLAYPSGCSYFRPFRYRDTWVEPSLLGTLQSQEGLQELVDKNAILAMRFQDPAHKSCLLPVRSVTITHVSFTPGNTSVFFRFGQFCQADSSIPLSQQCLLFDAEHIPPDERLFFWAEPQHSPRLVDIKQEDEAWVRWTEALAGDGELPIRIEAKRAVFIRICRIRAKKLAPVEQIYNSWEQGALSGFSMSEGRPYELTYMHRVPCLFNTGKSLPKVVMSASTATKNLEFAQTSQEMASNYQQHVCTFTPIAPSASWEEVELVPDKEEVATAEGESVYLRSISFKLRVKRSFWRRFCLVHVWIILLGLLLIAKEAVGPFLSGESNYKVLSGAAVGDHCRMGKTLIAEEAIPRC